MASVFLRVPIDAHYNSLAAFASLSPLAQPTAAMPGWSSYRRFHAYLSSNGWGLVGAKQPQAGSTVREVDRVNLPYLGPAAVL